MPRPTKCRRVKALPDITYFKPRGVPLRELTEVYLTLEGYEALRLADLKGMTHAEAAQRMQVSRQTFSRILAAARRTVAEAVVTGLALRIEGGSYEIITGRQGGGSHKASACLTASARSSAAADGSAPRDGHGGPAQTEGLKLAVSAAAPDLEAPLDPRFGRAAGFIVVDPQTMAFEYLENAAGRSGARGAGPQTAALVVGAGANVVLTGEVGPKALRALKAAGVVVVQDLAGLTVREAVARYRQSEVREDEPHDGGVHGS